ncbi:MAG: UvrD-helicase domain-containing protein [Prevotellaceae bacterium]|jgi:DNA helicase-2/ATP-dependent DNA helicase PcrA|nr:UvrD-helicase domain-containing protein [Prevotellaceae bacterium]
MSDIFSTLNPVQREAVESYQGASLVIAGAGSGKTRVLTCRIANMLAQGVAPSSVLALTFTNKAAKEMKERIMSAAGERARFLWMGTFHSIFARILRREAERVGFTPSFTIYDTTDSRSLLRTIIKEMKLDENVYKVNDVHARISMAKNNLVTPQSYASSSSISANDVQARKPHMSQIYAAYARRCIAANAMDFDDLLLFTNVLFRDCPDVLQKYIDKLHYVLVDEYQDTNYAQYLIVKRLTSERRNLCVVGDDAQSIYSFRGAKIENILNFQRDFPECKIFKLEQNYRSTQSIVNAANSVIAQNSGQLRKKCFSAGEQGEKVGLLPAFTDQEEGLRVASDISDCIYGAQAQYSDFAILYRTNAQSRIFEDSLRRKNIPYRIYGGQSFYQRKEIKDLLAYLRLIVNHHDDEAFKRIVNYPRRGIGEATIARLEEVASQSNLSLWDSILSLTPEQAELRGTAYKKVSQFLLMVDSMSSAAVGQEAYELAYAVAQQSGMLAELRSDKTIEGLARLENTEELLNGVKEFCDRYMEENGTPPTIAQYLENVSLLTDADKEKPEEVNSVSLMTVHSAKGMEYAYVYVVGMEENLFPGKLAMMSGAELEEERRLFYVALTRAKVKATLSFAQSRYRWGKQESNSPSRFIREIDPAYLNISAMSPDEDSFSQDPDDYTGEGFARRSAKPTLARPAHTPSHAPMQRKKSPLSVNFTPSNTDSIAVGALVEHKSFGRGKVLDIEDAGGDVKVTVDFKLVGKKSLLMKYAKLMVVEKK